MKAKDINDFVSKSIDYYMSGEDGGSFHIEPPDDLTPEIRNLLSAILNQIRTIRIPKLPKDVSPGLLNSLEQNKQISYNIKVILESIQSTLSNKSSIMSISSSIDDSKKQIEVGNRKLIANLQAIHSELNKFNVSTKKTVEQFKKALSGSDMDKLVISEISNSIKEQNETNRLLSSNMKEIAEMISKPKKWELDLQRDSNGFLTKIIANDIG